MSQTKPLLSLYNVMVWAGIIYLLEFTQWKSWWLHGWLQKKSDIIFIDIIFLYTHGNEKSENSSTCSIDLSSRVCWARLTHFKESQTWRFTLILYSKVQRYVCTYLKGPLIRICPQGTDKMRVTVSGHHGCGFRSLSCSLRHQLTIAHFTVLHSAHYCLQAQWIALFIFIFSTLSQ